MTKLKCQILSSTNPKGQVYIQKKLYLHHLCKSFANLHTCMFSVSAMNICQ
jgi:hypothetical protein